MFIDFIKQFWVQLLAVAVVGYLLGSISTSIIVTKFFSKKRDIRDMGSGNAGFTNVLRSVGIAPAALTFLGDFFKCIVAIFIAKIIFYFVNFHPIPQHYIVQYSAYIAGFFCVVGHIYPCFFGFRGGKSIVTAFAMMVATHWQVGLIILVIFLMVLLASKIVSLASITCATLYPAVHFFSLRLLIFKDTYDNMTKNYMLFTTIVTIFIAIIVIYKHMPNIKRLLNGSEKKISRAKNTSPQ